MQSLEDILETNKEAVEKAKKYDFLKNDMESLNTKISSLSQSYYDNWLRAIWWQVMDTMHFKSHMDLPNDNQMDLRSRTQLLIYHGR